MSAVQRVLFVQPFDAYAGSQRVAEAIVNAFAAAGVNVAIKLGFGGRGFLSEVPGVRPDVRCGHIPTRKLLYPLWIMLALAPVAWAAIRGRVVWANTVYAIPPALLAILIAPRRTVVHLHEATFPAPFRLLIRFAGWRGSRLVCVSADQAQRLGVAAAILPNPVSRPTTDYISARKDRLLFVGTTQPIKGFDLYVAVCRRLTGVALRKTAYLSDEDRHDRALVDAARGVGIDVVFGERSPDVMYADGFLVLLCTDARVCAETFSLVAAEAVTRLVPVAGTGIIVLGEVVGEALAFNDPRRDPDLIAQAIADLHRAPERAAVLRAACAERRPHFSTEIFANRLLDLLKKQGAAS
ncbi:hypothetical protein [Brevundimonas sp.]|uniref:hypothetical protein n=1 Tax=Brevundimonas sp. TaxID=1871086 RepID=UPI002C50B8A1|nr:hypothetical protein [Brevundimonas sp.]HWQ88271.1 hypothetical protein [Brevundimonas sp.]